MKNDKEEIDLIFLLRVNDNIWWQALVMLLLSLYSYAGLIVSVDNSEPIGLRE